MNSKTQTEKTAIFWLSRLNSPDLTDAQEASFFQWLKDSPDHSEAYLRAEQLWQRGAVLNINPQPKTSWLSLFFIRWQQAAACCMCITIVVLSYVHFASSAPPIAENIFQTAIGKQAQHTLDCGSNIKLNTNTSVRIELLPNQRIAYIDKGEVFFDVAKEGRPFKVVTPSGVIRVLGTRFSVYNDGQDTLVTVAEGHVALGKNQLDDQPFTPLATLQANQQLSLHAANSGKPASSIDAKRALSWMDKKLIYRGQRLELVIQDLNRYFDQDIKVADTTLHDINVFGVIHLGQIDQTTTALAQSLNLGIKKDKARSSVTFYQTH